MPEPNVPNNENEEKKIDLTEGQEELNKAKKDLASEDRNVTEKKNSESQKAKRSVEKILKEQKAEFEKKKQEMYFAELNKDRDPEHQITSYDQLTVVQQKELQDYKLPDDIVDSMIDTTTEKINEITKERNVEYGQHAEKIDEIYEAALENIARLEGELNATDLTEEEIKAKTEELDGWKKLRDEIGPKAKDTQGIRKTLASALVNMKEARENAVKGMAAVYPEDRVYQNKKAQELMTKEQREKVEKTKGEEDEPRQNSQKPSQQQGKQKANTQQAGAQQTTLGDESTKKDGPVTLTQEEKDILLANPLKAFGFNPDNGYNFKNSEAFLRKYMDSPFTDKEKLEMLNNPEFMEVVLKSMKTAGQHHWPNKKAKMFDSTRDKLLEFAKNGLMQKALDSAGIKDYDLSNIKSKFLEAEKEYQDKIKDIQSKLDAEKDPAMREVLEEQLAVQNEKYGTLANAAKFYKGTRGIETIRTRYNSFKEFMTGSNRVKKLKEGFSDKVNEIKEKNKDEEPEEDELVVENDEPEEVAVMGNVTEEPKKIFKVKGKNEENIEKKVSYEPTSSRDDFMGGLQSGHIKPEEKSVEELKKMAQEQSKLKDTQPPVEKKDDHQK